MNRWNTSTEPRKTIQDIARTFGRADEENRKLIFSEKEAIWLKYSPQLSVGKIFEARVGSVEDYGAFVHLRFPDGLYHLTGLVHVSVVSTEITSEVQDVRDIKSRNAVDE
ncbi:UNVERIFIED_CONTAM: hypothetical protein Scaly_0573600 [Sesamum calycinum]|uniref:S1 motif domain-containing protein n=1 Tax=Sesamum calycinum TaxID=2727403 RepID=A0AAW2RTQ8_9LAMI